MATIKAASEADVIDAVAAARDAKRTLEIVGGGTRRGFGVPVAADDVLDVSGHSGIVKYEPEELVLKARAGTKVSEINAVLAEKNQRLGFEPSDWAALYGTTPGITTIGGALSADANGAAAVRFGRARDSLLGYRAVNGFAKAYRAGSDVVKNVTGFDLPKLVCGAMGTLSVLTEVTLRVFPRPEHVWSLAIYDVATERAFALMRDVLASGISPTALTFVPGHDDASSGIATIRIEGSSASIARKREMLRAMVGRGSLTDVPNGDAVLARTSSAAVMAQAEDNVWRVQLPATEAMALIAAWKPKRWLADWGGAALWMLDVENEDAVARHALVAKHGGHARLVRGSDAARQFAFPPMSEQERALSLSVKAAFDSLGLFNPGRMGL